MSISEKQLAHVQSIGRANRTHGLSYDGIYATWKSMIRRCGDVKYSQFEHYGLRGISVCERWLQIENFLTDMGPRPSGTSLERIDVNGHYEPGNCRWASQREQMQNMRTTVKMTLNGETKSIHDWATQLAVSPRTLATRKRSGWSDERTLTTPVDKRLSRWKKGDSPRARNRGGVAA